MLTALAWALVSLSAPADSATVCRTGAVEMILGGSGAAPCPSVAGRPAGHSPSDPASARRIPPAQQVVRDSERRRILESELQQELAELARIHLTSDPADRAALIRVQDNIAALNRELAMVADPQLGR